MSVSEHLRVLVVDDDPSVRSYVEAVLQRQDYDVVAVESVDEARIELEQSRVELVVTDLRMPGASGRELLSELRRSHPDIPALALTGVDDIDVAGEVLALGALGYVLKPFTASELLISIANVLQRHLREQDLREARTRLSGTVMQRTRELRASREETLTRLALAVELRDDSTGKHIERVSRYAYRIASELGLDAEHCELIRLATPLHDIGKIAIPDVILHKRGPLAEEELRLVRTHPEVGARLLGGSGSELLDLAASIALTHHERLDGSGYPAGLVGDAIPLEGRIAAVADVYDAVTTNRTYSPAVPPAEARRILESGRATLFDPRVVDALFAVLEDLAPAFPAPEAA